MVNKPEPEATPAPEPRKKAGSKAKKTRRPPKPRIMMPGMIRCPSCGKPLSVTAMSCRKCGKVFVVNTASVITGVIVVTAFFLAMIGIALSMLSFAVGLLIKTFIG